MPKNKSWGENAKSVEARTRKADARRVEDEKKTKAAEDAYWADDNTKLAKKQNKKDEQEKKRLEKAQKKQESKQLERDESAQIVKATQSQSQNPIKVTQAQIAAEKEKREAAARKASAVASKAPKPAPLVENLNRALPVEEEATTVDEALRMLTVNDSSSTPDRHPERRAKAAYRAYEEARLPQLKADNPSLRLTQLKQMIFDEWKKSPENPMNQEHAQYNS